MDSVVLRAVKTMSRVPVRADRATMKKWKIERFQNSMTGTCVTTSKAYARSVELFAMWCEGTGVGLHPSDATHLDIRKYLGERLDAGVSAHTRNQFLMALRKYYRWCLRESVYLVKVDPTLRVSSAQEKPKLPRPLNQQEALALCVVYVNDHSRRTNALDRLIVEILYGSGLRNGEICSLTLESVSSNGLSLRFVGKGNKERLAPMSQPCVEALKVWMSYRGLHAGALLLTEKGAPIQDHHIQIMVKDRALRAGIVGDVWPHKLRHSFATHLLENGAQCFDIQTLLGHSDPSTVARYTRVSPELLKREYAAHDPSQARWVKEQMQRQWRLCLPSF